MKTTSEQRTARRAHTVAILAYRIAPAGERNRRYRAVVEAATAVLKADIAAKKLRMRAPARVKECERQAAE